MRLKSRSGLIATAIAAAAIAAPGAQASGLAGVAGSPAVAAHEEGQSLRWYESHPATTTSAVRPNPDEQAPASEATGSKPVNVGDRLLSGNLLRTTPVAGHEAPSTAKPAVTASSGSQGFQFDDAAIGGGVMLGVVLLGGGTALAVRRRSQLSHA